MLAFIRYVYISRNILCRLRENVMLVPLFFSCPIASWYKKSKYRSWYMYMASNIVDHRVCVSLCSLIPSLQTRCKRASCASDQKCKLVLFKPDKYKVDNIYNVVQVFNCGGAAVLKRCKLDWSLPDKPPTSRCLLFCYKVFTDKEPPAPSLT